jgi:hypothetical protein
LVYGACSFVVTSPMLPNAPNWATICPQSWRSAAAGAAFLIVSSSIASAAALSPLTSASTKARPMAPGSPEPVLVGTSLPGEAEAAGAAGADASPGDDDEGDDAGDDDEGDDAGDGVAPPGEQAAIPSEAIVTRATSIERRTKGHPPVPT